MLYVTTLNSYLNKERKDELTLADGKALFAVISKKGTISFQYRPTLKCRTRIKMVLGRFPEMALQEARELVTEYRAKIAHGQDPRKIQAAKIQENIKELTFLEMYEYWYETQCIKNKKNHQQHKRSYEIHVAPIVSSILYKDIKISTWANIFESLSNRVPGIAERLLVDLKQVVKHNINHGRIKHANSLANFTASDFNISKNQTKRRLSDNEIELFFTSIDNSAMADKNKIYMELLLYYGCRSCELRLTEVSWLDFENGLWTVPYHLHKTGHKTHMPLVRPITNDAEQLWRRAIEISASERYVFTKMLNRKDQSQECMTKGSAEDLPNSLIRWNSLNNTQYNGIECDLNWEHWSNHDLRRTARSNWSRMGPWAVCEKMLGHKLPGESDVYDYYGYIDEMTLIYNQWYAYLQELRKSSK